MERCESLDRFDFNNDCAIYEYINAVALLDFNPLIHQGQRFLTLNLKLKLRQFIRQTKFICGFEEPWPKIPVNFDCRANDLFSQLI